MNNQLQKFFNDLKDRSYPSNIVRFFITFYFLIDTNLGLMFFLEYLIYRDKRAVYSIIGRLLHYRILETAMLFQTLAFYYFSDVNFINDSKELFIKNRQKLI